MTGTQNPPPPACPPLSIIGSPFDPCRLQVQTGKSHQSNALRERTLGGGAVVKEDREEEEKEAGEGRVEVVEPAEAASQPVRGG